MREKATEEKRAKAAADNRAKIEEERRARAEEAYRAKAAAEMRAKAATERAEKKAKAEEEMRAKAAAEMSAEAAAEMRATAEAEMKAKATAEAAIYHDKQEKETTMIPVNRRKVEICMLLSVITGGIYAIYWMYLLVKNVRALKQDDGSCTGEMLCLMLIPFYSLYWWYTRGNDVKNLLEARDYHIASTGTLYIVLSLFGSGLAAMAIMQNDFNALPFAESVS